MKLKQRGLNITKVDGIIGEETRNAVRSVQQELKLPADGYPDAQNNIVTHQQGFTR